MAQIDMREINKFSDILTTQVLDIFTALSRPGEEVRVVGGAVRDSLLGLPVQEIDFATTLTPEQVIECTKAAGIKAVPTGISHGTVTLIHNWRAFEVTTLREDIITDGRHAVVSFGRNWHKDAERRDFTINAMSMDENGTIYDPINGYPDIEARHLRFIKDAGSRIKEDYLRILRFFRLLAQLPGFSCDNMTLNAISDNKQGISALSAERKWNEIEKILMTSHFFSIIAKMADLGVLQVLINSKRIYIDDLARLTEVEQRRQLQASIVCRLAAFSCKTLAKAEKIARLFKLAKVKTTRLKLAVKLTKQLQNNKHKKIVAAAIFYHYGLSSYYDALMLAETRSAPQDRYLYNDLYDLPLTWGNPEFPVSGRDLIAIGFSQGPALGEALEYLQLLWLKSIFTMDRDEILQHAEKLHKSDKLAINM